jgi:hypothetical protein
MEFNSNSLNLDKSATKNVKYRQADKTGLIYVLKKFELKHWSLRRVQVDCKESARSLARHHVCHILLPTVFLLLGGRHFVMIIA